MGVHIETEDGASFMGEFIPEIREVRKDEQERIFSLVMEVFLEFEAPDYAEEGIETFRKTGIDDADYVAELKIYGAFMQGKPIGMIATRRQGSHIALFFVKGDFHRRGIGKKLFEKAFENYSGQVITVNSSPYAHQVYEHLGFKDTNTEQTVGGVRFIPMKRERHTS